MGPAVSTIKSLYLPPEQLATPNADPLDHTLVLYFPIADAFNASYYVPKRSELAQRVKDLVSQALSIDSSQFEVQLPINPITGSPNND